ncbi:hypothetical protein PIB30_110352 [Stylosanthes scabra]|uniref:Uncharacterized protein n=1 Tax=Stylosanthes scabra TaxID=79078 RepID=A0ABU6W074_9FABA|nr:hypothetical protein [Stylosanthes scabra]
MEIVLLIYALMMDMPVCLASVMRYAKNADPTKTKTRLLIFPMFITKWARENNVPRFPGDVILKFQSPNSFSPMGSGVRMMKKLHLLFHHRQPLQQEQRAGSAENGIAEEDEDFDSDEATGDASTYAGEESTEEE